METVTDFLFLGCKITADSYCSHEIKRHLLLGRKAMTVQLSCSVVSDCLRPHGLKHTGFPIHYQLLELAQTHVHQVGDAIHHLILCCRLLFPPSIFPSIRLFSNESVPHIRWPKYWIFSFSISPSNEYSELLSFRMYWLDLLQSKGLSRVFSNTTVQKHQFFGTQLYVPTLTSVHDYWKNHSFD